MKKIILILFSVLFLNQQVLAVTLFEALTEAYKNNTDLNAERENINISKEDLKISKGNYLPTVTISGSKSQEDTSKLTNRSGVEQSVNDVDPSTQSIKIEQTSGKVTIADADIVVSGGRGLKGPENWNMIEELADVLGAATACSKPVSDLGWRPHSEHVGQTGKPVATNLYIAIGISGAIQHLAGINSSKIKVVINNDPEAPFFKAADYGVVGDAFDVVPRLNEKLKEFKAQNS